MSHDVLVFGPVGEGGLTISGTPFPMPGWAWSCSCHEAGFGYPTEAEADEWADLHARQPLP